MSVEIDLLLSDEFVKFSTTIAGIHAEKKKRSEDFKVLLETYKKSVAELDANAVNASIEFEKWKAAKLQAKK